MKRRNLGGWSLACWLVLGTGVLAAPVPEPEVAPAVPAADPATLPHITFDKTELDLGDVVHGKDAVAAFTYRNTGSVPLHILSAKPG